MDQNLLRQREGLCTQENPPKCTAECPVHVDVRGMISALKKKDYTGAYKLYSKSVPFPRVISYICEQPCQSKCLRNQLDQPVLIRELEKHIVSQGQNSQGKVLIPPAKKEKVAVIGSGLSGLTLAKTLKLKGYQVTIFEKGTRLGGKLNDLSEATLPREVLELDFNVFKALDLEIHLNNEIGKNGTTGWEAVKSQFDAIYLDVSKDQLENCTEGHITLKENEILLNPITLETEMSGVFAGGGIRREAQGYSPIRSVSDGKIAANSIDRLLQKVSLSADRVNEASMETRLYTNLEWEISLEPVFPENPLTGYTQVEALREAERCILCECLECVKACVFMAHYKGYPKRYFREIYNNLSIVMGIHYANKMINTCSECGLCAHICPNGADMGEVVQEARNQMVTTKKMPPSAHDFALRDMAFSKSEKFALCKPQPEHEATKYLFFPGCQLAGSKPEHIEKTYLWLINHLQGGVGLMLDCCGAPALWSGRRDLFEEGLKAIKATWEAHHKPQLILACPSCYRLFKEELPEMEIEMVYNLMDDSEDFIGKKESKTGKLLAVHDSCSTRYHTALHDSVRSLANKLGHEIEELPLNKDKTTCCGYGGLMMFADKEMAEKVISKRISESQADYLVYCAMCRDNFAGQGKTTYHLLDLIFGDTAETFGEAAGPHGHTGSPDFSTRHENRARLKRSLLEKYWTIKVEEEEKTMELIFSEAIRRVMEKRSILVEDVEGVMENMVRTGQKMLNPETDLYLTYFRPGAVTYWVEFKTLLEGYEIINVYSHRLEIES